VSEHCPICAAVKPGLPAAARSAGMDALVVADAELEGRLAIPGTPYVIVVDRLGIVRSKGTVNNLEQLEGLVDTAEQRIDEDRVRAEAM
jgi:HPt (histidine-containing phosphotransfer) domain-containing protein